jgi:hypothetical protein
MKTELLPADAVQRKGRNNRDKNRETEQQAHHKPRGRGQRSDGSTKILLIQSDTHCDASHITVMTSDDI